MLLKELLHHYNKFAIYSFANNVLLLNKISKLNKKDLIEVVSNYLLEENNLKELLVTLDDKNIKNLHKACLNSFKVSEDNICEYHQIISIFCATVNKDMYLEIPQDIKEVFLKIYKDDYINEQRNKNWILQCLKFAEGFYLFTPVKEFVKLVKKNKFFTNYNKEEIMDLYFSLFEGLRSSFYDKSSETIINYVENEEYYEYIFNEQDDKPFYIPSKREIEYWFGNGFFDNIYYQNMLDILDVEGLKRKLLHFHMYKIISSSDNKHLLEELLDTVNFENDDDFENFYHIYQELCNNTRMIFNRGYTPNELFKVMYDIPLVESKNEEPANFLNFPLNNHFSIDNPCPCGSGKKYKDCCMEKGIRFYSERDNFKN